jgi:putative oxidoreductase
MRLARMIGLWLVTLLLAALSILVGTIKFTQAASWDRAFVAWGHPSWLRPVVGVAEIGSGALVLVPPLAVYGAATMGIVMMGALATHIVHGEFNRVPPPLLLLTFSTIVFFARRPRWMHARPRVVAT